MGGCVGGMVSQRDDSMDCGPRGEICEELARDAMIGAAAYNSDSLQAVSLNRLRTEPEPRGASGPNGNGHRVPLGESG